MGEASPLDYLLAQSRYTRWANEKVLDAAGALREDQLDVRLAEGTPTIRENLQHVLGAQQVWLARWQGLATKPQPGMSLHELRAGYAESHAEIERYVAGLNAAQLAAPLAYRDFAGNPHELPLWQVIAQPLFHAIHHRAEMGLVLASLGHSPGDMDIVYFALTEEEEGA